MVETVREVYCREKRLKSFFDNMNLTGLISYTFSQEALKTKDPQPQTQKKRYERPRAGGTVG
jgi:hypothetical protein